MIRALLVTLAIAAAASSLAWAQWDTSQTPYERAATMIAHTRHPEAFEPLPSETDVAIRHGASGVVCRFSPDIIAMHTVAASADDVGCEGMSATGERVRFLVSRTSDSVDAEAESYFRTYRDSFSDATEQAAPSAEGDTRTATFLRPAPGGRPGHRFTRLRVLVRDGWLLRMYADDAAEAGVTTSPVGIAKWDATVAEWTLP